MKRRLKTPSVLIASLLVLTNCGGSNTADEAPVEEQSATTTPVTETPEEAAVETVEDEETDEETDEESGEETREALISLLVASMPFEEPEFVACVIDAIHEDLGTPYDAMLSQILSGEEGTAEWEESFGTAFVTCSTLLTQGQIDLLLQDEESEEPLASDELTAEIQESLQAWLSANNAPSSSLSVLLPDGSQINIAEGTRDRDGNPATTEDYWRIASITKPLTSAVVLKLVEEGSIGIDEPVMTYLGKEWAYGYVLDEVDYAPLITIRQILNHTDGFREYAFDPGFYLMVSDRLDVEMEPQEIVDWAFGVGPQYIPGTEYSYNTVGHVVAGLVIEAVTGQSAHEVMREYLFSPAGAPDMYLTPKEFPPNMVPSMFVQGQLADLISLLPGLAPYLDDATYGEWLDLSVGPQEVLTSAPWTGGGVEAQMDDLARAFKAMFDGTILKEETIDLFSEKAIDTSYALGIQLSERVGYQTFEHGGGVPGFRSHARYYPELDISIALSTNLIPVDPDVGAIADEVTLIVLDHLEEAGWELPDRISDGDAPEDPNQGNVG